tara:strand:- start:1032 stop:2735 length:1704 start_codon:yes stop_codon:yes gene_type:complete
VKLFLSIYNSLQYKEKIRFYWITFFITILLLLEFLSLSLILPLIKIIFSADKITLLNKDFFFNNISFEKQVMYLVGVLIFLYIFKNIFYAFIIYLKKKFLAEIQVNFTSRVFKNYLNQSYDYFLKNNKPQIIRNLGILAEYINTLESFINIVIEILMLILVIFIIYYSSIYVGLFVTLFSLFFIFFIYKAFKKRFRKYGELVNQYNEKVVNNYLDSLGSIKDIILQKKENFFIKDFSRNISILAEVNVKNSFLLELPRLIIEVFLIIGISVLVLSLVLSNQDINEVIVILTFTVALILRAIPSVSRVIYNLSGINFKIDIIKKVQNLIKSFEIKNEKSEIKRIDFRKIIFKNVSFGYGGSDNKNLLFQNLNLEINKNEAIGIIGSSGSGKSSLMDLISCILKPQSGAICLDEKEINNKLVDSWQNKISYISQKNFLLNGSILHNIAFGEDESIINQERLDNAIKFSQLENLVNSKEKGINYIIGEDGKNISGGQRQRIILARAIYRDADLIFFDEATSALDKKTETEIMNLIKKNLYSKKTIIISTHKRELLDFCHKVINVDEIKLN